MNELGLVMLASAAGGVTRYWLAALIAARVDGMFPWGTLFINVSGALAIGVIAAAASAAVGVFGDPAVWRVCVIGFLGSYTTVSSFSLHTLVLVQNGQRWEAAANIVLSVVLCLAAAAIGFAAGGLIAGAQGLRP
jgi:fluoride exporter